jgi:hypothetical protein
MRLHCISRTSCELRSLMPDAQASARPGQDSERPGHMAVVSTTRTVYVVGISRV